MRVHWDKNNDDNDDIAWNAEWLITKTFLQHLQAHKASIPSAINLCKHISIAIMLHFIIPGHKYHMEYHSYRRFAYKPVNVAFFCEQYNKIKITKQILLDVAYTLSPPTFIKSVCTILYKKKTTEKWWAFSHVTINY